MMKNHFSYIIKLLSILILFAVLIALHEHFNIKIRNEFNESFSSMTFMASYTLSVCMYSLFGLLLYLIPNVSNYKNSNLRFNMKKCMLLSAPIVVLLLLIGPGQYFKIFSVLYSLLGKFMMTLTSGFSGIILSVTLGYVVALCIESIPKEEKEV